MLQVRFYSDNKSEIGLYLNRYRISESCPPFHSALSILLGLETEAMAEFERKVLNTWENSTRDTKKLKKEI